MEERQQVINDAFRQRYGKPANIWTRAPGRVDLMGSHTDYNMGYVMTMTINRDTWLAAAARDDNLVNISSLNVPGQASFSLGDIQRDHDVSWSNYVRGVAIMLQEAGYLLQGFDGLVHSTVPFGSGLSSSAAIEMAVAMLFKALGQLDIQPVDMALIGQRAENEFVGVNTGILDQYSAVMGRQGCAIKLDCRQLTSDPVPIDPSLHIVICNTCSERSLVGSEYDERRAQCEAGVTILREFYPEITALRDVTPSMFARRRSALPEVVARRCQFVIEENQRVLDLADALPLGDPEKLRSLFDDSYRGARDLYEIVSPAMEVMIRAMKSAPGVVAARQTGAGFGGCMVALVQDGYLDHFTNHVIGIYSKETGIQPEIYPVEASPGASRL